MVTFEDQGRTLPAAGSEEAEAGTTDQDVRHLEEELRRTEEELQSTIEELETSKEELETMNEELAAANAELQETNLAVRRSEEMLRRVTDALPVLISYVDVGGRFGMVNATYEAWFGRPRAEIEGRTVEEVLGEEAWAKTGPAWGRALAGEESEFEGELTVGVKGPRYVSVVRVPHRDDEGRVRRVFNLITDLTAREEAAQALRESQERYREKARALAEADRRKDEFLAMLGHELRNPLSPIRNAVEMLREHGAELDPAKAQRAVEIVSRQLAQLTRLVDDLLDVARITRGQIRIERRPVRLASVLERAVETARPLFDARGLHFRLIPPEGELWVAADPDRLAQAVGNLLHNAAKFTPEGGEVSVTVARQFRKRFGAGMVLLALTGYGRDQDRARGLEAGFDHYLLKPVSYDVLEELLAGETPESEAPGSAAAE